MKARLLAVALAALLASGPGAAVELTDPNNRTTTRTWKQKTADQPVAYGSEIATSPTDPTDIVSYIQEQAASGGASYTFGQEAEDIPASPGTGDYFEANDNIDLQVGHDPDFFEEDGTTQEQVLPTGNVYQYNGTAWILVAETGTNLSRTVGSSTTIIRSNTGTDVTLSPATVNTSGLMTASQRAKFDRIEDGADITDRANVYAQVKDIIQDGSNVTTTDDDSAQTVTIASTGTGGGSGLDRVYSGVSLDGEGTQASPLNVVNPFEAHDETKLDGIAANAEVNVQADWNETASTLDSFIRNKPAVDDAFDSVSFSNSSLRLNFGHLGGGTSGVPLTVLREFQGADLSSQTTFGKGDYTQVGSNLYMATATSTTLTNPSTEIPGHASFVRLGLVYADGTTISGDGRAASSALAVPDGGISSAKLTTNVALRGDPTAPTPSSGDNDTSVATTAFVTAAIAAGTPAQDHTNRAAVSTDTNLSLTEYNAGTTSATDSITIPTWTGSRYVFIGTPSDEGDITQILSGGINVISSWTCTSTEIQGHKWCRTIDSQSDVISGATYQIVQ